MVYQFNFTGLYLLVALWCVSLDRTNGIPINPPTAKNNYNENHANRPLLPNQQPQPQHNRPPHQQPGSSGSSQNHNKGPEIEDFGRLHTSHPQFRRHAIIPPDGKLTPGPTLFQQHNPPEQFGQPGGNNFHPIFLDDNNNSHGFRNSRISQPDAQEPYNNNIRQHDFGFERNPFPNLRQPPRTHPYQRDAPFPRDRLNHFQREEFHEPFNPLDNEIFRERSGSSVPPHNPESNHINPFQSHHQSDPLLPPASLLVDIEPSSFSGAHPKNSVVLIKKKVSSIPPPPTTAVMAVIVQTADGNSTLFIEYDVSDFDDTYETTVEVDDVPTAVAPY